IEAAIYEDPEIAQAVVSLRQDQTGNKRLVAYYVPTESSSVDALAIKDQLQLKLPEYMVPSAFVAMESLPLTSSGKVDRRGLPAPDNSRLLAESGFVKPSTSTERRMAEIWCEVLGIEEVGIHDNFFELGGHSLLATRLNSRLMTAFRKKLRLSELFDHPTIANLARRIDSVLGMESKQIEPFNRSAREVIPLSFAQQRLWFLDQLEDDLNAYNMPFTWRLRGDLNREALRRALEELV
nr:non-ribosomal peptide synthetase [Planctomycetaceae bacterium]MCP4462972.1 non-ribosomal peptide synthetase [Planctomycetaceae bacterium]